LDRLDLLDAPYTYDMILDYLGIDDYWKNKMRLRIGMNVVLLFDFFSFEIIPRNHLDNDQDIIEKENYGWDPNHIKAILASTLEITWPVIPMQFRDEPNDR
jgi:hypothetical protein